MVKGKLAPAFALALLAAAAAAQDSRTFRLLVAFGSTAPGADTPRYAEALASALSRSPLLGEIRLASGSEGLAEEAGKLGYDIALDAGLAPSGSGALLSWRLYAASGGYLIGAGEASTALPDARSLQGPFWLDLLTSLESMLEGVDSRRGVRLFVVGPPGAVVRGIEASPLVLPEDGVAELNLTVPATLAWTADAKGYDGRAGILSVFEQKPTVLHLDMRPQLLWTIDLGLYNGAFLDAWASRRLLDDRMFLRAGFRQYLVGISMLDAEPGFDPPPFVSLPLIQPGLGGGALFGRPGGALRLYAGALVTARIVIPGSVGAFIDPIAPLSLEPFLGIEWRPMARCGFFGEMYAPIYLFADTDLFAASVKKAEGPSALYIYGRGTVLSIPELRFGARFYL